MGFGLQPLLMANANSVVAMKACLMAGEIMASFRVVRQRKSDEFFRRFRAALGLRRAGLTPKLGISPIFGVRAAQSRLFCDVGAGAPKLRRALGAPEFATVDPLEDEFACRGRLRPDGERLAGAF